MKILKSACGLSALALLLLYSTETLPAGTPADQPLRPPRRGADLIEDRWRHAHRQRAFPLEEIPPGARLRALEQIEAAKAEAPAAPGFGPFEFFNIGPNPILAGNVPNSGRVSAIAVDPVNVNHWLIGAAQGGIWETWNAGSTWKPRTDDKASLSMGAITFAPSNPQIIYAGTGEANFAYENYAGAGLLKSTTRGTNWFLLAANQFAQSSFSDIRVHPSDADTLVAATTRGVLGRVAAGTNIPPSAPPRGVFRSVNGGVNWTHTLAGEATDLETDPGNFNHQYAALGEIYGHHTNGVYRSTDGGQNWTRINGPWTSLVEATNTGRIEMAIAPSDPDTLYVSVGRPRLAPGAAFVGIWRTDNAWSGTPSWTLISESGEPYANGNYKAIWYYHELIVHPANASILYVGVYEIWRYNGVAWDEFLPGNVHSDFHAFAWQRKQSEDRLVVGNDGGVWSVKDDTGSWMNHNEGLAITQFYEGSVDPTGGDLALGASQDNGTEVWTGSEQWQWIYGGDGADNAISASNPENHWALSWQYANVLRTKDGGANFNSAVTGLSGAGTDAAPFTSRFEKHPGDDNLFILGTTKLWRCTNFFANTTPHWYSNSPVLLLADGLPADITALAFALSDPDGMTYAYGTQDGQLRLTSSGGAMWRDIDPDNDVPGRYVTDIAFHPSDATVLYVTLSGFDEGTPGAPGHVFKLDISGPQLMFLDWANVSPPVNIPHQSIVVSPLNPDLLYVGTDIGVWRSLNAGGTWVHLGPSAGMPNVAVFELQMSAEGRLTAFTHGRGAFAYLPAGPKIKIKELCPVFPCGFTWVHPGDWVTLPIALQSIITVDALNVTARVLATDDVMPLSGPQNYGRLTVNGPPVEKSFTLQIGSAARAAGGDCGGIVMVTLALDDSGRDLGTVKFPVRLGRPTQPLSETFEQSTPPALPTGWRAILTGAGTAWSITTNRPPNEIPRRSPPDAVSDPPEPGFEPPNIAAFAPAPAGVSDNMLFSPPFRVSTALAQLSFRHAFDFEMGRDGGVLEISIGGAAFMDITSALGSFADNGYNHMLPTINPLAGRQAWSGDSGGWLVSLVNLPAAAAGRDIVLRWRAGTDPTGAGGGWFIGDVTVTEYICLPAVTNPVLLRPRRNRDQFAFDLNTVAGRTYFVEYKNSLNATTWLPLRTVNGDGAEHTIADAIGSIAQRYYRFRVE